MTNPMLRANPESRIKTHPADHVDRTSPTIDSFRRRRSAWRQKLVDAERGLAHSFRADSALHLHLFFDCLMLATCGVLGLTAIHWAVVVASLTTMLSAELFYQGLQALAAECSPTARKQASTVAAAAKLLAFCGSTAAMAIILCLRFRELFGAG
jgi:diacylglycerol kinase